ncbi:hypothetical protein ABZ668_35055, partial [Streptomyces parvus]
MTALEGVGRAEEAETLLRDCIVAADCPGNYGVLLVELLVRQGRLDDAVEAVRPMFEDRWNGLLQSTVMMLAEHGCHDQALQLLEERSAYWLGPVVKLPSAARRLARTLAALPKCPGSSATRP